jgi:hypothetical protein
MPAAHDALAECYRLGMATFMRLIRIIPMAVLLILSAVLNSPLDPHKKQNLPSQTCPKPWQYEVWCAVYLVASGALMFFDQWKTWDINRVTDAVPVADDLEGQFGIAPGGRERQRQETPRTAAAVPRIPSFSASLRAIVSPAQSRWVLPRWLSHTSSGPAPANGLWKRRARIYSSSDGEPPTAGYLRERSTHPVCLRSRFSGGFGTSWRSTSRPDCTSEHRARFRGRSHD